MHAYSREFLFEFEDTDKHFFELPSVAHGVLERLIIAKHSGDLTSLNVNLYTRRGACYGGIDLFCRGGAIETVTNQDGHVRLKTTAPHQFLGGETLLLKDTGTVLDLQIATVESVVDADTIDLDLDYTAVSVGFWQIEPKVYPLMPASAYLLYKSTTLPIEVFDLNRKFENRDNQDVTGRTRQTKVYMECEANNTGLVMVAYTMHPRSD